MLRQSAQQNHPPIVTMQPFMFDSRLRSEKLPYSQLPHLGVYNMHRGGMPAHIKIKFPLRASIEFQTFKLMIEPDTQILIQPVDTDNGKFYAQCIALQINSRLQELYVGKLVKIRMD